MDALRIVDAAFRQMRRDASSLLWIPFIWAAATSVLIIITWSQGSDVLGAICTPLSLLYALPVAGTPTLPDLQTAASVFIISVGVTVCVWLIRVAPLVPQSPSELAHSLVGAVFLTIALELIRWIGESMVLAFLAYSPMQMLPWTGIGYHITWQWGGVWIIVFGAAWLSAAYGAHVLRLPKRTPHISRLALGLSLAIGLYTVAACYLVTTVAYYGFAADSDFFYALHAVLPQAGVAFTLRLLAETVRVAATDQRWEAGHLSV